MDNFFHANIDPEALIDLGKDKETFTVKVPKRTMDKFNEILGHYQAKMPYAKMHKHIIFSVLVEDHWQKLKSKKVI